MSCIKNQEQSQGALSGAGIPGAQRAAIAQAAVTEVAEEALGHGLTQALFAAGRVPDAQRTFALCEAAAALARADVQQPTFRFLYDGNALWKAALTAATLRALSPEQRGAALLEILRRRQPGELRDGTEPPHEVVREAVQALVDLAVPAPGQGDIRPELLRQAAAYLGQLDYRGDTSILARVRDYPPTRANAAAVADYLRSARGVTREDTLAMIDWASGATPGDALPVFLAVAQRSARESAVLGTLLDRASAWPAGTEGRAARQSFYAATFALPAGDATQLLDRYADLVHGEMAGDPAFGATGEYILGEIERWRQAAARERDAAVALVSSRAAYLRPVAPPPSGAWRYLVGRDRQKRAVCVAWDAVGGRRINSRTIADMTEEAVAAGLSGTMQVWATHNAAPENAGDFKFFPLPADDVAGIQAAAGTTGFAMRPLAHE